MDSRKHYRTTILLTWPFIETIYIPSDGNSKTICEEDTRLFAIFVPLTEYTDRVSPKGALSIITCLPDTQIPTSLFDTLPIPVGLVTLKTFLELTSRPL